MKLFTDFTLALAALGALFLVAVRTPAYADVRARLVGREPYAYPLPTFALMLLVPVYMVINLQTTGRAVFTPITALDRAMPLAPTWTLVYCSMYVFAFLPAFVVRDVELRKRAVFAYISAQLVSYAVFLIYPTVGPRPTHLASTGFLTWSLNVNYALDPPYNCLPSLHVAYSFLAALTCRRVNRRLGAAALAYAVLIGLSTVYTKQHYVLDVVGGAALAFAASFVFLRGYSPETTSDDDRRRAPARALRAAYAFGGVVAVFWVAYTLGA